MQQQISISIAAIITVLMTQAVQANEIAELEKPLRLGEINRPATTVKEWLAQSSDPIQVTGVRLNATATGLEVILDTEQLVSPVTSVVGNALIIDIPNAVLVSPDGQLQTANPAQGIAFTSVINLPNRVRVTVTGMNAPPTASVQSKEAGIVLSVTPGVAETETVEDDTIQITVTGTQDEGYNPSAATTGTRIEAPLRDVPLTLQVIPRQVIEDRQIIRLTEVADNVPGVETSSGYGGLASNDYYIRGFKTGESFRNGFRDFTFISPRDPANVEQVEFLRGPASVLYGGGSNLSGAVNTITKRPLADPRYEVNGTIGNYGFYRSAIDLTGPLVDDGSLLYRLNLAYTNADSFRDFNESQSIFVAPVLTWNIGPRTTLTTEFEYQNYDYVFDRGFPPGEVFLQLPRDRFLFEPDVNRAQFNSYYFGYNLEHELNDQWKVRQGFGGLIINGETEAAVLGNYSSPFVDDDGRTLQRDAQRSDEQQENFSLQTEVIGEFSTGSINHNLLFGLEYARYRFAYDFFDATLGPIDIFNPVYGARPGTYVPSSFEEYGTRNIGIYLQDLVYLTPNLIVLAGGRLDFNNSFYRDTLNNTTNSERSETSFSPRLGIVYQPGENTSLYFNWANAFTPTVLGGITRAGQPFEPERGQQFEIGLKQDFSDRLSANLAFYHLTRQNVSTPDPEDPDFSIQTGEQTSRGIELDVRGEILPGWNMIATYALTDAFVSEDNDLPVGDRLAGIPKNTASLWSTYEIQSGDWQGLGFGLGLVYVDEREAQLPNTTVTLPSYFRTDASLFYRRDNWRAAVNFKNLFSVEYFNTQGFFMTPQASFTVLANISVEF
ncbi:TonB-dependent siderophore receptor [Gloeocapsopsis dulcis]|uniref:TonB-dependent siderophore receptor n=1 Tax=Gloeocapsopsis dulcis AAB1 = 1H9 TaxID=1433147 RepID=A0A6N8FNW0_9CHRO|nr:TonB-dependent siderophore receptor [Gloeocapsopsis dulcis]MUL34901.1 TonB-dependent siderophore receptor [Gloeocapsopsis dulcis AAB1 = 1H9]WNN90028.1 TonB-dependent siderophore receptor [Gloeocapsopsis dulcis]